MFQAPCILLTRAIAIFAAVLVFQQTLSAQIFVPDVEYRTLDEVNLALAETTTLERRLSPIVDAAAVDGRPSLGLIIENDPLGPEVLQVKPGTAADLAGIIQGDNIKSIGAADVDTVDQVEAAIARHPIGKVLVLTYLRKNELITKRIRFTVPSEDAVPATGLLSRNIDRDRIEELEVELVLLKREMAKLRATVRFLLKSHPDVSK